jgi:hypothetical protein
MALYKPSPQARYLVDRVAESEKNIHDAFSQLTSQLASIEKKVDSTMVDLGKVQEKVNLAISKVQEEQVLAAKQLKPTSSSMPGAGVMGPAPTQASSASVPMNSPPSPPPDRFLQKKQVNPVPPPPRHHQQLDMHLDSDRSDSRCTWMSKMDFPHFEGTDARIWLDKCLAYFMLYLIPQV